MTPAETAAFLRRYNEWRRDDEDISQFDVCKIGEAIDAAVEMIERLEAAESGAIEQARLNDMGSEREAALMAKLDAAEKERAIDEQRIADLMEELNRVGHENDALRAKIAEMEKQEPAWFIDERGEPKKYHKSKADYCKYGGLDLLYALPGAKGETK